MVRSDQERPLAVFDIDGVLADVRHRLHFVAGRHKDWDGFFAAATHDLPLPEGVRLARASAQDCDVVYLTGRPERCRADTLAWLNRHGLPAGALSMRRSRDFRPSWVAKLEQLRRLARSRTVAVAVDDDAQVCDAYERAGFRVLRAGWMATAPPPAGASGPTAPPTAVQQILREAQEESGRT
jgi:phosphoglycolate phosphatase-like HAD superfamily hydrolase